MSNIKLEDVEAMSDEDIANLTYDDHVEIEKQRDDIKRKAALDTNAQDLRTQVLEHGIFMIEKLQSGIHNDEPLSGNQARSYEMLWPVITDLISKTEDLKIIKAKNASEIVTAVSKGKMSLRDAAAMMAILKEQVTIDELPKLLEKLAEAESK